RRRLHVLGTGLALVGGGFRPAACPAGPVGRAVVLAAGTSGSIAHHSWWDPRGWFGRSPVPKPRQIAAGGPRAGALPRQAAVSPARRVRELTAQRNAFSRVFALSDGRVQAEVSAVPVNYRDARGVWRPIDTTVRPTTAAPGYGYSDVSNTFRSFFGAAADRLVRFEVPGGGWLAVGL